MRSIRPSTKLHLTTSGQSEVTDMAMRFFAVREDSRTLFFPLFLRSVLLLSGGAEHPRSAERGHSSEGWYEYAAARG